MAIVKRPILTRGDIDALLTPKPKGLADDFSMASVLDATAGHPGRRSAWLGRAFGSALPPRRRSRSVI